MGGPLVEQRVLEWPRPSISFLDIPNKIWESYVLIEMDEYPSKNILIWNLFDPIRSDPNFGFRYTKSLMAWTIMPRRSCRHCLQNELPLVLEMTLKLFSKIFTKIVY